MAVKNKFFFILALLISIVKCQTNSGIFEQDTETSFAPSTEATTTVVTTVAPTTPLVPTTAVCDKCSCKDGNIDCSDLLLKNFFTQADWLGVADEKPKTIDLHGNDFTVVTPFVSLTVETLNLSRCSIETIERASFKKLQQLKVLDLSYNNLTADKLSPHAFEGSYAPELFEPLSSMRTLNLAYNNLHALDQNLFEHMSKLTELDLSGNPLGIIAHVTIVAISSLLNLKVLNLRSCQLKAIPDKFLHAPRFLESLDLSNNQLKRVPPELEETKNLVYLNLNQNPIEVIDIYSEEFPGFPLLPNLEELHMCNVPELQTIPDGALGGLTGLKRLYISNNKALSYIHPKALATIDDKGENFVWPQLTELCLRGNNLTQVESGLVPQWDVLTVLDIRDNPYLCNCSTQWMVDKLVPLVEHWRQNASEDMVCKSPVQMVDKTMKYIHDNKKTMRCADKYGNRPERDGMLLMGALIGVLLAVPIMLTLTLLWRRGYFASCGARGPAEFSRAFYKRAQSDDFNY